MFYQGENNKLAFASIQYVAMNEKISTKTPRTNTEISWVLEGFKKILVEKVSHLDSVQEE